MKKRDVMMKICFLMRSEFESVHGGDVVQVKKYIEELEKMGHECSMVGRFPKKNYDKYIIVNIDRPIELYVFYKNLKANNKKYYIVPIHHPINAVDKFERLVRNSNIKYLAKIIPDFYLREKVKDFMKLFKKSWYFKYAFFNLFKSYKKMVREVIRESEGLFCIAEQEAKSIEDRFSVSFTQHVVRNSVELKKSSAISDIQHKSFEVIVVGRIEERKNQLSVIHALQGLNIQIAFVGAISEYATSYQNTFLNLISSGANLTFLGTVSHDDLIQIYSNCKLLLNASYFEVSPLVDIEAAVSGCRVVTTMYGYTNESIMNVPLVDPYNLDEIKDTVMNELNKWPESHQINPEVFSWSFAAQRIHNVLTCNNGKNGTVL